MTYKEVDQNPSFPELEKEVLAAWKSQNAFKRSIDQRADAHEFVFYDGPPFANGLPHYGHLLTGYVKDVFARYQTMRGQKVERRFGWDCHGLPAEMGSEKELGISGRAAITNFGIGKFNEHCRTSVMKYTQEWEDYVNRQARWVDFKNDYKTMDKNFMESVLWAFKQLYDKGLVYEAYRVMPYSWAAETPLSNFETKLDNSYREKEDKAITVAFELNTPPKGAPKADKYYVLAWTTTPWTLPSNLALAASKDVDYVYKLENGNCYIQSTKSLGVLHTPKDVIGAAVAIANIAWNAKPSTELDVVEVRAAGEPYSYKFMLPKERSYELHSNYISGADIIGLSYHPLFPYFKDHSHHAFKILDGSSFVTDGDGTGIVHMAPGFGEEDQKCCEKNGIEVVVPVDGQGKYTDAIFDLPDLKLKGLNVIAQSEGAAADEPYKPEQLKKYGLANLRIINWLKQHGQLIKQEDYKHSYPHCWRTDQPLIYRAMPSWYVEVTKFRDRAVEVNKTINWIPDHIRDGQMAHMLATAPDWSISRNRFWGTPIPVWRREDSGSSGQDSGIKVFGSIAEMEEFFDLDASLNPESRILNPRITDLHRPFIDNLTVAKDGSKWRRVEDVFDCWFESGSMPFAQVHYPFENKEWFETHFPADFITEYVGQTRGWFNTLIMLSTALFDRAPFKNCICHGVVLDSETGLKYSKRLKNYKDPMEVMDKFGADALRWLMISSPVMRGHDLAVDPEGKFIRDVVRLAIKPIWNAYNFFVMYANADSISCGPQSGSTGSHAADGDPAQSLRASQDNENIMDRYILAKCAGAVEQIKTALDAYDTPTACEAVLQFFEALNNWYIRRNKERFWKEEKDTDKQAAYDTLYSVLVAMCEAAAPLLPLTLDAVYRGLTGKESVHLADFPTMTTVATDKALIAQMDFAQDICNTALGIRNKLNLRVRQPLSALTLVSKNARDISAVENIIRDEVNVKNLSFSADFDAAATLKLSINSAVLGKRLPEKMKQILPASKKGEWKTVGGAVEIAGEKLQAGEYTLLLEPKPDFQNRAQALSTNDALVILDTVITPELEAEGIARDVVRLIQQARKDAGLNITDRIALSVVASDKTKAALSANKNYISEQTLTAKWHDDSLTNASFTAKGTVEGDEVTISLSVAA